MFETISSAGMAVPPHKHENEDEYGYVIEGTFEVYLDGQTFKATNGAVIYCPRHSWHGFRNIGSTTAKMVWISTPGASVEQFFEDLAALPSDVPPDMEKIIAIFGKYQMEVLPPPGMKIHRDIYV